MPLSQTSRVALPSSQHPHVFAGTYTCHMATFVGVKNQPGKALEGPVRLNITVHNRRNPHCPVVLPFPCAVRHALPCSPVNLVQLLFAWLPRGFRSRVLPQACLKRWLIPLDGYVPDAIASSPAMLLVTGPSEIGYLAFMFLMYPLFASIGKPQACPAGSRVRLS